jgi:sulfur carrier protein ThiS
VLQGCGTAVPRPFKARNAPITTITQAKATCKPHETVCGIPGRENTFEFECIDINTAGDSCMFTPQIIHYRFVTNYFPQGGGCMTPPSFPQVDPVLHVFGIDCTRISNAINSECSGQHCIVSKCNFGWHPNQARDTCILDASGPSNLKLRKVLKREDSLTANVVANANVSSDLVAKIGAIVSLVSGLECTPSQIPANSSSSLAAAVIYDLLNRIVDGTSTLIASTNVPSLLNNLGALLNVSSLLSSTISDCETDLGLTDLEDALGSTVAALVNLKSWCALNVPSDLDLSGLLSGLGFNNSTVAAVVNPDLVDQIEYLVGLVVGLVSSSLSPPTSPTNVSLINTNIVNSIVNATVYIVNATTVPSLVSSIGSLVNANGLASSLLDDCGCVSALGTLVADMAQVANATLRMQDWCDTYPVASISATGNSSTGTSTSISNTDELPIDLGLSNLLGLLLEPVESGVAASGTATNTLANGLLGGLAGGPLISTGVPPISAVTAVNGLNDDAPLTNPLLAASVSV